MKYFNLLLFSLVFFSFSLLVTSCSSDDDSSAVSNTGTDPDPDPDLDPDPDPDPMSFLEIVAENNGFYGEFVPGSQISSDTYTTDSDKVYSDYYIDNRPYLVVRVRNTTSSDVSFSTTNLDATSILTLSGANDFNLNIPEIDAPLNVDYYQEGGSLEEDKIIIPVSGNSYTDVIFELSGTSPDFGSRVEAVFKVSQNEIELDGQYGLEFPGVDEMFVYERLYNTCSFIPTLASNFNDFSRKVDGVFVSEDGTAGSLGQGNGQDNIFYAVENNSGGDGLYKVGRAVTGGGDLIHEFTGGQITTLPNTAFIDIDTFTVEAYGAGGGGGGTSNSGLLNGAGGGGGSGAYATATVTDVPTAGDLSITIGAGGAAGISNTTAGGSGGNTFVIYNSIGLLNAGGGNGGAPGLNDGAIAAPGTGGFIISSGPGGIVGNPGLPGTPTNGQDGGIGGGAPNNGTDPLAGGQTSSVTSFDKAGENGNNYGAGGGGASRGVSQNGGRGADGAVRITYTCPTP